MKKLIKSSVVFAPLLLLLVGVNYLGDPAKIFNSGKHENDIVKILLKGLNAANISNYDERLLQKLYIEGFKGKIDAIVLGSSRAMQVGSNIFPNISFCNNCVSGATFEDFIAIFEIYEENNKTPKAIIFSLDPWLLNKNNGQTRWKSLAHYYWQAAKRIHICQMKKPWQSEDIFQAEKYLQLFSLSYFQQSVRNLLSQKAARNQCYPTELIDLDVDVKLIDGTLSYNNKFRSKNTAEVLKEAQSYLSERPVYSLGNFYELDKTREAEFECFLNYLLIKKIKILFFLAPYHPYVYEYLSNSNEYKTIKDAEDYFKNIASKNDILMVGSYNPQVCGLRQDDFYDGMHPKREAIKKIINGKGIVLLNLIYGPKWIE